MGAFYHVYPDPLTPAAEHLEFDDRDGVTIIRFRDPRVTDPGEIEELGRQLYRVLERSNSSKLRDRPSARRIPA